MGNIIHLPLSEALIASSFVKTNDALCDALREKMLKSFQVIEQEGLPIIREINRTIQSTFPDGITQANSPEQLEALAKAKTIVNEMQSLVACFQNIFIHSDA